MDCFRHYVKRVAMERAGKVVNRTYEANPGEWEEAEFWIDLSVKMDPDGELGIKQYFASPYREARSSRSTSTSGGCSRTASPGCPRRPRRRG